MYLKTLAASNNLCNSPKRIVRQLCSLPLTFRMYNCAVMLSLDLPTTSQTRHPILSLPHIVDLAVDLMQIRLWSWKEESATVSQMAHCLWTAANYQMLEQSHHCDTTLVSFCTLFTLFISSYLSDSCLKFLTPVFPFTPTFLPLVIVQTCKQPRCCHRALV